MIKNFKSRKLKRFFERGDKSQVRADFVEKIENILFVLDSSNNIDGLDVPGFRLHPLTGDHKGFWSVTVRANWRIIFRFEDGNAFDVNLIDYH